MLYLRDYQLEAVKKMKTGCILNGGTGSGKSLTGLYYYFTKYGGSITGKYVPMKNAPDLYIITTAAKRDKKEWDLELSNFLLSQDKKDNRGKNKIFVDSWNNICKYSDVRNAFFIFDEDRVTGNGAWVKAFLKIARWNDWFILSATPGDKWEDFIPVFLANGFYKNKTEFVREHLVYSKYCKFRVDRYLNTQRLNRLRNNILVDMDCARHTTQNHIDIWTEYDRTRYNLIMRDRWDPWNDKPIDTASELCYALRKSVNSDNSKIEKLFEIFEDHPRIVVFYNFDYERDMLLAQYYGDAEIAEWSGHAHQPVPESRSWLYLVQYTAGAEAWQCTKTDTMVFFSQNYSYKTMTQAAGRIDRMNTPYEDLYYYHLKSRSGIDVAISKALKNKKKFNESRWCNKGSV